MTYPTGTCPECGRVYEMQGCYECPKCMTFWDEGDAEGFEAQREQDEYFRVGRFSDR